jgi:hypothetical protein
VLGGMLESRYVAVMKETEYLTRANGSFGRMEERVVMRMCDVEESDCARAQVFRDGLV